MDKNICATEHCKSHEYVERTMEQLREITAKLAEGQAQIISVVNNVSRLSERVEKLENRQDEMRGWMYKIMGVITVVGFAAPMLITYFLK